MLKDERDLLEVLKRELIFLEKGGYQSSRSWKPHFIFEDSPTCPNYGSPDYDCREHRSPCTDCVLIDLVPPERRSEKFPCRHIPLNVLGETLDSLYRYCDQQEVEERVGNWLRATIERLEKERNTRDQNSGKQLPRGEGMKGTSLYESLHPKCANPACPAAFHWLGGGKFFRFRPEDTSSTQNQPGADSATEHPGLKHYWLCEGCSCIFTLAYEPKDGVVLKPHWLGLPMAKVSGENE